MAETDVTGAAKKSKGAAKQKKSKSAPSHPKVSEMVNSAISSLKERGGSSVHAIKKYTASHYKVDIEKLSPFIKKYLRSAVASGALVQTKGKGASGSFRMSASSSPTKEKTVSKAKKSPKEVVATKKPKVTPKKAVKPKKAAEKKKPKKAPAATKKAKPAKSPKKPVKAAKSKAAAAAKPKKAKASPKKSAASKRGKK